MRGSTLLLATLVILSLASTAEVARESAPNRTKRPLGDTTHHLAPAKLYRGGVLDTIVVRAPAPFSTCVSKVGLRRTQDTTCAVGDRVHEGGRSRE